MPNLNEYKKALKKIEKNPKDRIGIIAKLGLMGMGGAAGTGIAMATGGSALVTIAGVSFGVVAAPVGLVAVAAAGGVVLVYGLTKLYSSGVKSDIKTQENIRKLKEEINKTIAKQKFGTDEDISKLTKVYQELISLEAISEELVKDLFVSIENNKIDFVFAYKTALELLEQKQNNIKLLKN
jgi:Na+/glutamate symporter